MRLLRILFYSAIIIGLAIYFYGSVEIDPHDHHYTKHKAYEADGMKNIVSSFEELNINCNCEVTLLQAEEWSVTSSSHHHSLKTQIRNQTLHLSGGNPKDDLEVIISTPKLTKIKMTGMASLKGEGTFEAESISIHMSGMTETEMELSANHVHVNLSGATEIELSGYANLASYTISGVGELEAHDLKSKEVTIDISGAGDAEVYASHMLDAKVSGTGEVKYKGRPQNVRKHVSGVGSISAD